MQLFGFVRGFVSLIDVVWVGRGLLISRSGVLGCFVFMMIAVGGGFCLVGLAL